MCAFNPFTLDCLVVLNLGVDKNLHASAQSLKWVEAVEVVGDIQMCHSHTSGKSTLITHKQHHEVGWQADVLMNFVEMSKLSIPFKRSKQARG